MRSGIPEDDLPHIFDKYFRGTTAKMQPGSGLGLSAVWGIAKAHHGVVKVANRAEGGAEFSILLPGSLRCNADGTAADGTAV